MNPIIRAICQALIIISALMIGISVLASLTGCGGGDPAVDCAARPELCK